MSSTIKLVVVCFILLLNLESVAQTAIAIKAGTGVSNINRKITDYQNTVKVQGEYIPSFHIGVAAESAISDRFSIGWGVQFIKRGSREGSLTFASNKKQLSEMYFLDVPLTFKGTHTIKRTKLFAAVGPYISVGLFGEIKNKQEVLYGDIIYQNVKIWSTQEFREGINRGYQYSKMDGGLNFQLGVEINRYQLSTYYQLGLADTAIEGVFWKQGFKTHTSRNRGFGCSLAVFFVQTKSKEGSSAFLF